MDRVILLRLGCAAVIAGVATACDINNSSPAPADASPDANDGSCIAEAGPDVDPLMTCSPSGCIPFDNSAVPPNVPRL